MSFSKFGNFGGNSLKDILARGIMAFCAKKDITRDEDLCVVTSSRIFELLLQELSPEDAKEASEKALALTDVPAGLVLFDVPIMAFEDDRIQMPDKFHFMSRKGLAYIQAEGIR